MKKSMDERRLHGFTAVLGALAIFASALPVQGAEILLQHGNITVTRGDVEQEIALRVPPKHREVLLSNESKLRQLIANIFMRRALAAEAREAGLDQRPSVAFELSLQANRVLMKARLEQRVEEEMPDEKAFERLAKEYYRAHPEEFGRPAQVRASHILVSTEDRSEAEARELAEELRSRAVAHPGEAAFAELAQAHSDDPASANNGGSLGWFAREKMVEPFSDAAFALDSTGSISPVVKTRFGYHIIRLEDRRPAGTASFDEVKSGVIDMLETRERKKIKQKELERIRSLPGVAVDQEAIKRMSVAGDSPR